MKNSSCKGQVVRSKQCYANSSGPGVLGKQRWARNAKQAVKGAVLGICVVFNLIGLEIFPKEPKGLKHVHQCGSDNPNFYHTRRHCYSTLKIPGVNLIHIIRVNFALLQN